MGSIQFRFVNFTGKDPTPIVLLRNWRVRGQIILNPARPRLHKGIEQKLNLIMSMEAEQIQTGIRKITAPSLAAKYRGKRELYK